MSAQIEILDFEKVDIRVGRIVDVQDFPEARTVLVRLVRSTLVLPG